MAKGKGKGGSSGGPRKNHGPKKHMFRWAGPMKWSLAKTGMLTREHDYEAWQQACTARGKRNISYIEFKNFVALTDEQKKEYFSNLKK